MGATGETMLKAQGIRWSTTTNEFFVTGSAIDVGLPTPGAQAHAGEERGAILGASSKGGITAGLSRGWRLVVQTAGRPQSSVEEAELLRTELEIGSVRQPKERV